tara:strand:- start:506 stop:1027 length:522 start_codon:yes stop_codon:yes gene_type:complete
MSTNLITLLKIILFSLFLVNCGILSEAEDPLNKDKDLRERHGDFVYDAIKKSRKNSPLGNIFGNSTSQFKENIIWNVALEKISFMPIQSSDQQSGVITTEWFQSGDDLNNRIKLVIYVKSDIVEDSAVEVKVFKEIFDGDKWNTASQNSELALKIKKSILDSAQELYIANEMS